MDTQTRKQVDKLFTKDFNTKKQRAIEEIKKMGNFPEIDFSSDNADKDIESFINLIFFDISENNKNSPTGNRWVDPSIYLEFKFKQEEKKEENPDHESEIKCAWIRGRGNHSGKVCFKTILSKNFEKNEYSVRCDECARNSSEKANKVNTEKFEEVLNGTEVKGSPTNFNSVSVNHIPAAAISGIDESAPISPITNKPVEKFLNGGNTGDPSPSKAKKKKKSPKNKKLTLSSIKNIELEENHKYFRSKQLINDSTWFVSQDKETDKYNVIGKIIGGKIDDIKESDLRNLEELDEKDLEETKTYNIVYKYFPKEKKNLLETTDFGNPEAGGKGSDFEDDEVIPGSDESDSCGDMISELELEIGV